MVCSDLFIKNAETVLGIGTVEFAGQLMCDARATAVAVTIPFALFAPWHFTYRDVSSFTQGSHDWMILPDAEKGVAGDVA